MIEDDTNTCLSWWELVEEEEEPFLMRHEFSGDPWGLCAKCDHPVYHRIHRVEEVRD